MVCYIETIEIHLKRRHRRISEIRLLFWLDRVEQTFIIKLTLSDLCAGMECDVEKLRPSTAAIYLIRHNINMAQWISTIFISITRSVKRERSICYVCVTNFDLICVSGAMPSLLWCQSAALSESHRMQLTVAIHIAPKQ